MGVWDHFPSIDRLHGDVHRAQAITLEKLSRIRAYDAEVINRSRETIMRSRELLEATRLPWPSHQAKPDEQGDM